MLSPIHNSHLITHLRSRHHNIEHGRGRHARDHVIMARQSVQRHHRSIGATDCIHLPHHHLTFGGRKYTPKKVFKNRLLAIPFYIKLKINNFKAYESAHYSLVYSKRQQLNREKTDRAVAGSCNEPSSRALNGERKAGDNVVMQRHRLEKLARLQVSYLLSYKQEPGILLMHQKIYGKVPKGKHLSTITLALVP